MECIALNYVVMTELLAIAVITNILSKSIFKINVEICDGISTPICSPISCPISG